MTTAAHPLDHTVSTSSATPLPLAVAGRILFALPFGAFGLMHLAQPTAMAGAVPAWVPGSGTFWVVVTGLALIAASVSIAINRLVAWSAPLLAVLLATFILSLHLPAVLHGDQMAVLSLLKDAALAGAALFFAAKLR